MPYQQPAAVLQNAFPHAMSVLQLLGLYGRQAAYKVAAFCATTEQVTADDWLLLVGSTAAAHQLHRQNHPLTSATASIESLHYFMQKDVGHQQLCSCGSCTARASRASCVTGHVAPRLSSRGRLVMHSIATILAGRGQPAVWRTRSSFWRSASSSSSSGSRHSASLAGHAAAAAAAAAAVYSRHYSSSSSTSCAGAHGFTQGYQLDPINTISYADIAAASFTNHSHGSSSSGSGSGKGKVVAVAISGGVDSAVSLLLLKRLGYEVFGVYMHNWDTSDEAGAPTCTSAADLEDAKSVCKALKVPLYEADFVSQYWNSVFAHFLEGLEQGLTPNPDLACNSHIKFGALLQFARDKGADVLATGHYARLGKRAVLVDPAVRGASSSGTYGALPGTAAAAAAGSTSAQQQQPVLLTGADVLKDQTYFLAGLNQQQLARAMFPVGHLTKAEVRQLAAAANLPMAAKRSSAGICFIGRRKFGRFLEDYLPPKPGVYVDVDSGKPLGDCYNMLAVTVGQRALGLGGQRERMYTVGKDLPSGVVYVAQGHDHPALYSRMVLLQQLNWVSGNLIAAAPAAGIDDNSSDEGVSFVCAYKARYRQATAACTVRPLMRGKAFAASRYCGQPDSVNKQQQQQQGKAAGAISTTGTADGSIRVGMSRPAMAVAPAKVGSTCFNENSAAPACPSQPQQQQQQWVAELDVPLRSVSPGQMFVLYDGGVCLGSAVIVAHGHTLAEQWEPDHKGRV